MLGRTVLSITGTALRVSADGSPEYKTGGLTIDWTTVAAAGGNSVLPWDNTPILTGQKYLRFGQCLARINGYAVTITISATGGTFTITVTVGAVPGSSLVAGVITSNNGANPTQTTAAIAWNATAAQVQAALALLTNIGTDFGGIARAQVSGAAGGPYTITLAKDLGTSTITTTAGALTGGGGTAVVAITNATGSTPGFYGPFDPTATDGRQTLVRGACWVLDEILFQYPAGTPLLSAANDQIGGIFDGGRVWKNRVLMAFAATGLAHSLVAGPTEAEFNAAFPRISYASDGNV